MNTKRISKFLSLVLRHKPEIIQLQLDPQGWASVEELLEKIKSKGFDIDYPSLEKIVAQNDKQRFKLSEDGSRIRANQGHSIAIDLALAPKDPPDILYHGTSTRFLDSIQEKGLLKMNRQHVHLSADKITAHKVGARHGKPAILLVDCKKMHDQGILFYLAENGVWLTDTVAPEYLRIVPK